MDDTIIMEEASISKARTLKNTLCKFASASGQLINWLKSEVFFINIPERRQQRISRILECRIIDLPVTYLGLPMGIVPPDPFWSSLVDKFYKKLVGWKVSLLSQAGKLQLLKASLQSISIYALSLFRIPVKYVDAIEKIQRILFWSGVEEKKRMSLVAWDQVCRPKSKGGLGLERVQTLNEDLMSKKVWRMFHSYNEWCKMWQSKYSLMSSSLSSFINLKISINGSHISNHASKCRESIAKGAIWKVGNGRRVKFWEEPWFFDKPLIDFPEWAPHAPSFIRIFGTLVEGYWTSNKWKNIESIHPSLIKLKIHLSLV